MIKLVAYCFLASVIHARLVRRRQVTQLVTTCPEVCEPSRCPPAACYYGLVRDPCGCCSVCAAGEGDSCGEHGEGVCGEGLVCNYPPGGQQHVHDHGYCACTSLDPVCGSDGRTYPSICRLRVENKRENGNPPILLIRKSPCNSGTHNPGSMRYKFNFIADVVDKIAPAVVHLELFRRFPFSDEEIPVSSGSGFIMSEDGWIITNAHVLSNKQRIKVELSSGVQYDAKVRDVDPKLDIALIKIESDSPLPVLHLGQSSDLRPGEFVVAVGSPFSLQNTVTTGIISTTQRTGLELGLKDVDMEYIQTDAIINYGNSGGPLVNLDGDVIGINTLKVTAGISFAIPADKIRQFLAESYERQLKGKRLPKKRYMGVRMLQLTPALIQDLRARERDFPDVTAGAYVFEVIPGAPAASAGMIDHDVIIAINGQPITTTEAVIKAVKTGAALSVVVRRANEDVTLTISPEEINL